MKLIWFEIRFDKFDLKEGLNDKYTTEIKKLHKLLNDLEGLTFYTKNNSKSETYYLSLPDNEVGRNLIQYFILRNFKSCYAPDISQIRYKVGYNIHNRDKKNKSRLPLDSIITNLNLALLFLTNSINVII